MFSTEALVSRVKLTSPPDTTALDSIINLNMDVYHVPGLAACVVADSQIVWTGAYGYTDAALTRPVTDSTLFLLASISKTFVATAVAQLWENGMVDLDADVNSYLPFLIKNPYYPDSPITLRAILSHTSSIARRDNICWVPYVVTGTDSPLPLGGFLADYLSPGGVRYDTLNYLPYPPGTFGRYSNVAYGLAGYIVEQVSGLSLEQYSQDSIFRPLGMNETSWFLSSLDTSHIAMPLYYTLGGYKPYGHTGLPIYPCGQLRTSSVQLARHLMAFMRNGKLDGVRILESNTVDSMRTIQYPDAPLAEAPGWEWGIGWARLNSPGLWGHTGGLWGCATFMFSNPADKTGFICLMNIDAQATTWETMFAYLLAFSEDGDHDGAIAGLDNCTGLSNPGQAESDGDGLGDACDNCPMVGNPSQDPVGPVGDVDFSGSITSADLIYMVNHVFKSGWEPLPCAAYGDANCSGTLTSADIVALVNFVFKSGAAPCDVCTMVTAAWSCP